MPSLAQKMQNQGAAYSQLSQRVQGKGTWDPGCPDNLVGAAPGQVGARPGLQPPCPRQPRGTGYGKGLLILGTPTPNQPGRCRTWAACHPQNPRNNPDAKLLAGCRIRGAPRACRIQGSREAGLQPLAQLVREMLDLGNTGGSRGA